VLARRAGLPQAVIAGAADARQPAQALDRDLAFDSLLEEVGFELLVPRKAPGVHGRYRLGFAPTISRCRK
jgi:hypothetical protein